MEEQSDRIKSPESYEEQFMAVLDDMAKTFIAKNADYGNSFSDVVAEIGLVAGLVPILHKCNRLKTLLSGNNPQVKDESIRDTLLDMANYCILLSMEIVK